jgi:large subunit ribosomal protein L7/L12
METRTMANATLSKDEILDAIGNMKVSELVELTDAFKEKFNVTIAVAAAGPAGGAAAAPAAEEQTEFAVVLTGAGAQKISTPALMAVTTAI